MHQKRSIWIKISLFFSFLCFPHFFYAAPAQVVKLAMLSSPYNEMPLIPLLSEYENAYFAGVKTAAEVAKKYGITIQYKPFVYGSDPLDILGIVPKVKQWQPDFILGPNSSDQFLMLRNSFSHVMVLSSYASDVTLQSMPKNFYSTSQPDNSIMKLLSKFVITEFPKKNILIVEQVDCKQCVDVGALFVDTYKKMAPQVNQITVKKIILDYIDTMHRHALMDGHLNDVVLVFNNSYYDYNAFVKRITSAYPGKNLVFLSDQDNWSSEVNGKAHKLDLAYRSYRIAPVIFDKSVARFQEFYKAYLAVYHKPPKDAISYVTFITVLSAIEALHRYPEPGANFREKILNSYFTALKNDPNWFRINSYGIYQLTSTGEMLVKKMPVT